MTTVTIEPATVARFQDAQAVFAGGGDGHSCQCQWPMLPGRAWETSTQAERTDMLREQLAATPVPALIAYVDAAPAGWVRIGPRPAQPRVARTRVVQQGTSEPLDDASVWAITCFSIAREYRSLGLMRALTDAAVELASAHGARVIEAYPIDTTAKKAGANDLFVGTVDMFEKAGFTVVSRPTDARAVVARTATAPSDIPERE